MTFDKEINPQIIKLYYLVINHKLNRVKKFSFLLPYENLLYDLVKDYERNDAFFIYFDKIIKLIMMMKDDIKYLDYNFIAFTHTSSNPMINFENMIALLYPDKLLDKQSDFDNGYLIQVFFRMVSYNKNREYSAFIFRKLNDFYLSLKTVDDNVDMAIISVIYAYIFLNKIDNFDYVMEYVNNIDYYDEVFKLNGINFNYSNKSDFYNYNYRRLFTLIDKIFSRKKIMIK